MITLSDYTQWLHSVITLSDNTEWLHSVITLSDDTQWWHSVMTLSDDTQWWHSVKTLSDNTQLRVEDDCSIVLSSSICERMKWLVMSQKRRVTRCYQPLECTPVFSQVPAEIPTGHLLGSILGCRWGDLYQRASKNSAGIPARIKTSKQNGMKSGFAGSPTNPIFHSHPTFR